jgi:hypothetical protein
LVKVSLIFLGATLGSVPGILVMGSIPDLRDFFQVCIIGDFLMNEKIESLGEKTCHFQ